MYHQNASGTSVEKKVLKHRETKHTGTMQTSDSPPGYLSMGPGGKNFLTKWRYYYY